MGAARAVRGSFGRCCDTVEATASVLNRHWSFAVFPSVRGAQEARSRSEYTFLVCRRAGRGSFDGCSDTVMV